MRTENYTDAVASFQFSVLSSPLYSFFVIELIELIELLFQILFRKRNANSNELADASARFPFSAFRFPLPSLRSHFSVFRSPYKKTILQGGTIFYFFRRFVDMSSLSKNQLKALAAYRIQKRCDEEGVFVVEGEKMCHEALASDHKILAICATADYLATTPNANIADNVYEVSSEQLERLSSLRTPNKVWMLVERKAESGERRAESGKRKAESGLRGGSFDLSEGRLVLALDGLQDPGNMGTIMRTADWYGIRHIVCSHDTVSVYNPKVVQATMGAIFRTRVEYVDLAEWIDEANKKGIATYGAMLDGTDYRSATLQGPAVLVVGNEGRGISAPVAARLHQRLTIPNVGGTCESLNAAVATAILVSRFF